MQLWDGIITIGIGSCTGKEGGLIGSFSTRYLDAAFEWV